MNIKFSVQISGRKVLLAHAQLEALSALMEGVEFMDEKWVGTSKGTTGANQSYLPVIEEFDVQNHLSVSVVSEEKVEAIKFVQKQQEKSE